MFSLCLAHFLSSGVVLVSVVSASRTRRSRRGSSGLRPVPRSVDFPIATLNAQSNVVFPLDTERVWRVRVRGKQCGMEIASIQDRVFTVAVTRPAQFSLDELFLGVRESCARRNVQRIQQNFGYRERETGRLIRSCSSLAHRERVGAGSCPVRALSTESYWTSDHPE